jgi:pimeloyl-ACP methyl ester carboxylesterase
VLRDIFRAVTGATAAIDRGVLRVMERQMSSTTPRDLPRDAREKLLQLAAAYRGATFFPEPPTPTAADVSEAREPDAYDAPVTSIRFASGYRPFLPLYREEHHRRIENHTAHARLYGTGRRPVMVCLHGWGGGTWWFEERAFVIGYWLRRGFDVALFQLPHHGERTRGRSGALFPSANLIRTNESFGQAIWDLRAFAAYLRARGAPSVGAMGMSLGGYTTALWAATDPALAFAVAMIPAVSMSELMWRHGEESPARRRAVAAGVSGDLLDDVFAVHAPTERRVLLPRERLMIVAGRGDRITPPDQAEKLWKHWGECAIHWFPGGHLAQVGRGDAFRAVRKHLQTAGLPGDVA